MQDSSDNGVINDVCFDIYGRRLAICSSDDKIKVWDIDENGEWKSNHGCEWRAHDGPISKISWAYPEFGQVLVSCSSDQTVKIWQEQVEPFAQNRWHLRATFLDSKDTVYDVEFSPSREVLQVACASGDSMIRIYEARDIMNLEEWVLEAAFVGDEESGVVTLSWNPSRFESSMLVAGMSNGSIKIFQKQGNNWTEAFILNSHQSLVRSISWAANMGRSFDLIASVEADGIIKIHKVRKQESSFNFEKVIVLDCGGGEVSKVRWNCSGTLLACSCTDGEVILWKSDFQGQWKKMNPNRDKLILGNVSTR